MRKLVVNTFLTLDGVMQAPGGPQEDPSGGFAYGGWSVNYWDEAMGQVMSEFMGKPFDLVLGRKTYEIFAAHWPFSDEPEAAVLNKAKKYVASTTLKEAEWSNSVILKDDVVREIRSLKEQDGPELQVHGSSSLIQTLLRNNLVDEFGVWIFPVVIGSGKRLFGSGAIPSGMHLTHSQVFSTGVIFAKYSPAGEIETGTFEQDQPSEVELARRERLRQEE